MRRIVFVLGAAVLALGLFPTIQASAGGGAEVTVIHGIGPGSNPVDVYVDGALVLEDVQFEDQASIGTVPAGTYNVQLCNHVGAAVDPLPGAGCPNGAVNSNVGSDVTVPAGAENVTLVAAYAGPDEPAAGRPTVAAFVNDVACYEAGDARVSATHAAFAPPVDVLADGSALFEDLAFGENQTADVPADSYDVLVELASDGTDVLDLGSVALAEGVNTNAIVVGNPQQDANYSVIVQTIELEPCPVDTTTTTTSTTSTTTTTIVTTTTTQPPVQPQRLTPTYTG